MRSSDLRDYVIRPTLKDIGLWSQSAEELLLGTAAHESHMGDYLKQVQGPALGIYQVEPATHRDIYQNYLAYHDDLADRVRSFVSIRHHLGSDEIPCANELVSNLAYATVIARLVYYRRPEALPQPSDLDGLARYYKRFYNTKRGSATEQDFIDAYKAMVLPA